MLKICLSTFIGVFLVRFIKDVESGIELLLAFGFSFLLGCHIGHYIASYFLSCKRNKKASLEIELLIKSYNDATATTENFFKKFQHS